MLTAFVALVEAALLISDVVGLLKASPARIMLSAVVPLLVIPVAYATTRALVACDKCDSDTSSRSNLVRSVSVRANGEEGKKDPCFATSLPIIKKGSKEWKDAVKAIKTEKSTNFRVENKDAAKDLLFEAKGEMTEYPAYIEMNPKYKKGFEFHPNESHTENAPHNDLPHIKWVDWSQGKKKGKGHIFYDD